MIPCTLSLQFVSLVKLYGFAFFIYFLAGIFASIGDEGYMLFGEPLGQLAAVLYQHSINFNFQRHITLLKGNAVDIDSLAHTLFGETSGTHPLQIVSEITIAVHFPCKPCNDRKISLTVAAKSSIRHMVEVAMKEWQDMVNFPLRKSSQQKARPKASQWMVDVDDITVQQDGLICNFSDRVVCYSLKKPFVLSSNILSIKKRLSVINQIYKQSSTYASFPTGNKDYVEQCNQAIAFCGFPLWNHRRNVGPHVTLYYVGFDRFMEKCDVITPTDEDCLAAAKLCSEMAQYFENEKARVFAFKSVLEKYIGIEMITGYAVSTGICDFVFAGTIAIGEGKGEIGQGGSESCSEALGYFSGSLDRRSYDTCPGPAFILEIVGPHLFISGAVLGEGVYFDRLAPGLWLVPQYQCERNMIQIARVLKALKEELSALAAYYKNISSLACPRFPTFQSFTKASTNEVHIEYKCSITGKLFQGSVEGEDVIIKFAERYSKEVHTLLEADGHAPKLHCFEKVTNMYYVVVMEKITGKCVDDYLENNSEKRGSVLKQCHAILSKLHLAGFCHGDFRSPNILVRGNGQVCVIDYEWSGKIGVASYPFFMNHVDIKWPEGAAYGQLIKAEHDLHWLNML